MINKILLLCSLLITQSSYSSIKEAPVPGGLKKIILSSSTRPLIKYQNKRTAIIKEDNHYVAIIGIPLNTPIQEQSAFQISPSEEQLSFIIKEKKYKVQKLTIKNTRKVTPLAKDEKRIIKEVIDFNRTIAHWMMVANPFKEKFTTPVRGYITSTYGLRRIYNGIPKSPHTALDIAAAKGTPIKAPASGRIINIHNRFYTGNTVILDHGQGLMSLYAHLSQVKVKNGQFIKQGEVLGLVGMTGRVTGPHLHWALYLNQTSIDPLLLIDRKDIMPIVKKGT